MEELVTKIRVRKGLKVYGLLPSFVFVLTTLVQPEIPSLDTYYDKL
jgi:hypothetical protein